MVRGNIFFHRIGAALARERAEEGWIVGVDGEINSTKLIDADDDPSRQLIKFFFFLNEFHSKKKFSLVNKHWNNNKHER